MLNGVAASLIGAAGLLGHYYEDTAFQSILSTRVDAEINFSQADWPNAPPGTGLTPDNQYSVLWTGYVKIDRDGDWTFYTTSDDGVRLRINNNLIIDSWHARTLSAEHEFTLYLREGLYPIRLEHFQNGDDVQIKLEYSGPGQERVVVPSTHFTHDRFVWSPVLPTFHDDTNTFGPDLGRYTYVPDPNSPIGQGLHPRLGLTQEMIPDLRAKIAAVYQDDFREFVRLTDACFNSDTSPLDARHLAFVSLIGEFDFVSYGHRDPVDGDLDPYREKAKDILLNFIQAEMAKYSSDPANYRPPVSDEPQYDELIATVMLYDWLYGSLNQAERDEIVEWLLINPYCIEGGRSIWSSDYFEATMPWYVGLGFYGDGVRYTDDRGVEIDADARAQELLDYFYVRMVDGGDLDAQNWAAGVNGGTTELGSYGQYHPYKHFLQLWPWYTATGDNYFESHGSFSKYPEYLLYRLKPAARPDGSSPGDQEWRYIKLGQATTTLSRACQYPQGLRTLDALLNEIDPELAALNRWMLENAAGDSPRYRYEMLDMFLMGDERIASQSPSELGLPSDVYYAGLGLSVMRSGWWESADPSLDFFPDTAITVLAPHYMLDGHSQWQAPRGFTIDKFGPLALQLNGYVRPNVSRYNCMLFTDPSEVLDGGFRSSSGAPDEATAYVPGSTWDIGGMKAVVYSEEASYMSMELTKQYLSDRVSSYTREFVYLKPDESEDSDYIVILDRVETARPEIVKRWEINSAYSPEINGTLNETESEDGKWVYSGADTITIKNYESVDPYTGEVTDIRTEGDPYSGIKHPEAQGKLFVRTLLPETVIVEKKGGPNRANPYEEPGYEFLKDDPSQDSASVVERDFVEAETSGAMYTGTFHTDVISAPETPTTRDNFLHVMQTAYGDGGGGEGARIHARSREHHR